MSERKLLELTVTKKIPAGERDQVSIWFDDPHAALEVAAQLIRMASDCIRDQSEGNVGITLLGIIKTVEEYSEG